MNHINKDYETRLNFAQNFKKIHADSNQDENKTFSYASAC